MVKWATFALDSKALQAIIKFLRGKPGTELVQSTLDEKFPEQEEEIFRIYQKTRINLENAAELCQQGKEHYPFFAAVRESIVKVDQDNGKNYAEDTEENKLTLDRLTYALIDSFIEQHNPGNANEDAAENAAENAEDLAEKKKKIEESKKEVPSKLFDPASKSSFSSLEADRPNHLSIFTIVASFYHSSEENKKKILDILALKDIEYSGDVAKDTRAAETRILRTLCDTEHGMGKVRLDLYSAYNNLHKTGVKASEDTIYDRILYRAEAQNERGQQEDSLNSLGVDAANAVAHLESKQQKKDDEDAAKVAKEAEEKEAAERAAAAKRAADAAAADAAAAEAVAAAAEAARLREQGSNPTGIPAKTAVPENFSSMSLAEKHAYYQSKATPSGANIVDRSKLTHFDPNKLPTNSLTAIENLLQNPAALDELGSSGCPVAYLQFLFYDTSVRIVNKSVTDGQKNETVSRQEASDKQDKHYSFVNRVHCNYFGSFSLGAHLHGGSRFAVLVFEKHRFNTTNRVTAMIEDMKSFSCYPDEDCVIVGEVLNVLMCMTESAIYAAKKQPKHFYNALAGSAPTTCDPPPTRGYIKATNLEQAKLYLGAREAWAEVLVAFFGGLGSSLSLAPCSINAHDGPRFRARLFPHTTTAFTILAGETVNDAGAGFDTVSAKCGGKVINLDGFLSHCDNAVETVLQLCKRLAIYNYLPYSEHPQVKEVADICLYGVDVATAETANPDVALVAPEKPPLAPAPVSSVAAQAPVVTQLPPQHVVITVSNESNRGGTSVARQRTEPGKGGRSKTPEIRLDSKDRRLLADHIAAKEQIGSRRDRGQDQQQGNEVTHRSNTPQGTFDLSGFLEKTRILKPHKEVFKNHLNIHPHAECPFHNARSHTLRNCSLVKDLPEEAIAALEKQVTFAKTKTKP